MDEEDWKQDEGYAFSEEKPLQLIAKVCCVAGGELRATVCLFCDHILDLLLYIVAVKRRHAYPSASLLYDD